MPAGGTKVRQAYFPKASRREGAAARAGRPTSQTGNGAEMVQG